MGILSRRGIGCRKASQGVGPSILFSYDDLATHKRQVNDDLNDELEGP